MYTDAQTACLLSSIAYCKYPQTALNTYLKGWTMVFDPVEVGGNYAFIATNGSKYALAIRGSLFSETWQAFEDWVYEDLNALYQVVWDYTNNGSSAMISRGAWDGFNNLQSLTDKKTGQSIWQVFDSLPAASPIIITGHSLGGNLSTVYASWLFWNFAASGHPRSNISVYTFAAPAAGNANFAADVNSKLPISARFENTNDIVPKFPCVKAIRGLLNLYQPVPLAYNIDVVRDGLDLSAYTIEYYENYYNSVYTQTNGTGTRFTFPLSGNYKNNTTTDWFNEAGYQHSVNNYCSRLGVPIVQCVPSILL